MSSIDSCAALTQIMEHCKATLRGKESFMDIIECVMRLSRAAQYFALFKKVSQVSHR